MEITLPLALSVAFLVGDFLAVIYLSIRYLRKESDGEAKEK